MATLAKSSRVAIGKILLATDFSSESQNALLFALSLAKRFESKFYIIHAIAAEASITAGETWPPATEVMRRNAEESMAGLEATEEVKSFPHEVIIRPGDPWTTMSEVIKNENIDLVIMGTHGMGGLNKLILGSTAEKVIRHATCPVMTVGPHVRLLPLDRLGRILFATDFSAGSMQALAYAVSLAEEDRAELTLLHIIEGKPASEAELVEWKRLDRERLSRLLPDDIDLAYKPDVEVEVGTPAEDIVRLSDTRNADLIVMGSHAGGTMSTHVPWTTLHHVLQHAHCPVLTVRAA